ncbi:Holliday junction branch migration protein RuvA [Liquorilactobacillus mali]|uniref:Holliday junction branch migration complex subunit RuvA n=1 Tax=Liquorilactobacillus mali KCTC 3596 = DSM 20444 TaxID=1046596 RepID=J0UTH0_9LACO|nr:Holliday junction branch migration protein RuvA [Liquorilactobacillus mali]EJF00717.1 Holliday junction DNA helicase RuvA [Liquorilactobacillus mali KCTC 3596 = DSM 20444]KRN11561.1 Holliday junction DNA helicase RuvA [Liquorilactobacillus mali KCTC 3596 = DSM 20444]MDC7952342.1 Holliday junction branch migration protein RuvA [Liquorilactobacillus mali]QFQ74308.1 Holliday junction branch migration protein RuvA [Liquorilactobacillus mali]
MYEYFEGLITTVTPYYIVVEIQGVGYQVYVANPFRYHVDLKKQKRVYIYQAVRENAITLYGFWNLAEKNLFLKLLNVSGIGPKSALAILANDNHLGLVEAINGENVVYLTKFPGVGKKTAQQIVLDLKGKLDDLSEQSDFAGQQSLEFKDDGVSNGNLTEALAALDALGYTKTETRKITKQLKQIDADSTDDYLRAALKLLMHN